MVALVAAGKTLLETTVFPSDSLIISINRVCKPPAAPTLLADHPRSSISGNSSIARNVNGGGGGGEAQNHFIEEDVCNALIRGCNNLIIEMKYSPISSSPADEKSAEKRPSGSSSSTCCAYLQFDHEFVMLLLQEHRLVQVAAQEAQMRFQLDDLYVEVLADL